MYLEDIPYSRFKIVYKKTAAVDMLLVYLLFVYVKVRICIATAVIRNKKKETNKNKLVHVRLLVHLHPVRSTFANNIGCP